MFFLLFIVHSINSQNTIDSTFFEDGKEYDCIEWMKITGSDTITMKHCVELKRDIFNSSKKYIYTANYYNQHYNTLSKSKITVTPTDLPWIEQPEHQRAVIYNFERFESDSSILHTFSDNFSCCEWVNFDTTGIVENEEQIWMHPFRSNQFILTEISPFPNVRLPILKGNKWSSTLDITGWGDWKNETFKNEYQIEKCETELIFDKEVEIWYINASSTNGKITNSVLFKFTKEFGFIEMNYNFYNGMKLVFVMEEITD